MNTIVTTFSGRRLDLLNPDWREIDLVDVAVALSQINRWGGQSRRTFSVAEHSLVVADIAQPQARLAALLHDAHEAFLGDWLRPAIEALAALTAGRCGRALSQLRRGLDVAIARRALEDAGVDYPVGLVIEATVLADEMTSPSVDHADDEAMRLEDAIRGSDALQSGPSPAKSHALTHYGLVAPSPGVVAENWLAAVRAAAIERGEAAR